MEGDACRFTRLAKPTNIQKEVCTLQRLHFEFNWKSAWSNLHTREELVPSDCSHIFFLFHALGSVKVSEQLCESLASTLKMLAKDRPSAATESIVAKCMMRVAGLNGSADDDRFILRMWSEMVGAKNVDSVPFFVKQIKQREAKFPLGKGSKTLHNYNLKMRARKRIKFMAKNCRRVLRPRCGQTATVHLWRRHARDSRALC